MTISLQKKIQVGLTAKGPNPDGIQASTVLLNGLNMLAALKRAASNRKIISFHVPFNHIKYCQILHFRAP